MLASTALPVMADDWVAVNLRGIVMQFDGKDWVHLNRGDIVSDARHIRTLASGRVEFERGQERISMAGDTDITINDARGRKMTTVNQMFGSVTIEAEKKERAALRGADTGAGSRGQGNAVYGHLQEWSGPGEG